MRSVRLRDRVLTLGARAVVGLVGVYARGSYHVGFSGDQVTIFRGRPDTVLWFDPTVAESTSLTRDDLTPAEIDGSRDRAPDRQPRRGAQPTWRGLGGDAAPTAAATATTSPTTPTTSTRAATSATATTSPPQQPAATTAATTAAP